MKSTKKLKCRCSSNDPSLNQEVLKLCIFMIALV